MDDLTSKISLSLISACLAILGKHFYDRLLKKKLIKKKKQLFIDIIENIVLSNLNLKLKNYQNLYSIYEDSVSRNEATNFYIISSLDSKLMDLFPNTELYDILKTKKIKFSEVYEAFHELDNFKTFLGARSLEATYLKDIEQLKNNNSSTFNEDIKERHKEFIETIYGQLTNVLRLRDMFHHLHLKIKT